jgi:hypothetical protein
MTRASISRSGELSAMQYMSGNAGLGVTNADDEIPAELSVQVAEETRNRLHIGEPSCGLHARVGQVQVEPQIPTRDVFGLRAARVGLQLLVDDPCFSRDPAPRFDKRSQSRLQSIRDVIQVRTVDVGVLGNDQAVTTPAIVEMRWIRTVY